MLLLPSWWGMHVMHWMDMLHISLAKPWDLSLTPIGKRHQRLLAMQVDPGKGALTKHDPGCHVHSCAFMDSHVHALVQ